LSGASASGQENDGVAYDFLPHLMCATRRAASCSTAEEIVPR
jgi:hypothetical protein